MGCPDCDFSTVMPDGTLICAIHDEQVHGDGECECWQSETRKVDGYDWFEVMEWPARKRRNQSS